MNILILEDDNAQKSLLVNILKKQYDDAEIFACSDLEKAMEIENKSDINLFLLDVEINESNSIDFAEKLIEKDFGYSKKIVFITAHQKYAVSAINRTHCFGYVEKPYDEETILKITDSCLKCKKDSDEDISFFNFKIRGVSHFVNKKRIMYIEFKNKKPILYSQDGEFYLPRMTVNELLERLEDDGENVYVRCRRDSVVNIHHISHIKNDNSINYVVLNNSTTLPIGDKYKEDLFSRLRV